MKNTTNNISIGMMALLLGTILLFSCKKSSDNHSNIHSFTWNYEGKAYSANIDSAFLHPPTSTGNPLIIAGTGNNITLPGSGPRITLISLATGNYLFGTSSNNSLEYVDTLGNSSISISGTITITANSTDKLSGNFSATMIDFSGLPKILTGNFSNVPIHP
jgi:hypothetical protein